MRTSDRSERVYCYKFRQQGTLSTKMADQPTFHELTGECLPQQSSDTAELESTVSTQGFSQDEDASEPCWRREMDELLALYPRMLCPQAKKENASKGSAKFNSLPAPIKFIRANRKKTKELN